MSKFGRSVVPTPYHFKNMNAKRKIAEHAAIFTPLLSLLIAI